MQPRIFRGFFRGGCPWPRSDKSDRLAAVDGDTVTCSIALKGKKTVATDTKMTMIKKERSTMELAAKQEKKTTAGQTTALSVPRTGRGLLTTKNMVLIAMFGALSGVLMYIQMPVPFAPPFYKLDFCDVPVLIGSFTMGPVAGILIAAVKILISLVLRGTQTAGVGEFSNWVQACSLSVPAALFYQHRKTRDSAFIGMAAGVVVMVAVACLTNAYIMLPAYAKAFHMPIDALVAMGTAVNPRIDSLMAFVLLAVAPFNLLKGALVAVLTALIYKRVSVIIKSV